MRGFFLLTASSHRLSAWEKTDELEGRAILHSVYLAASDVVRPSSFALCLANKPPSLSLSTPVASHEKIVVRPGGEKGTCPGTIAAMYEEIGGNVTYVGKSHGEVYAAVLGGLQMPCEGDPESATAPARERILAVGDSLHHDVAGALGAGIDVAFVTGGVHAFDLGITPGAGERASTDRLAELYREALGEGKAPTHVVDAFQW